jgi:hypothetical protein
MYSAYLHNKLANRHRDQSIKIEKSARSIENQQKIREKLLKKYQIRLTRRVIDMAVDPVPVNSRELTKSPKLMGYSIMRLRPRDSKDRVNDAVSKNNLLDSHPIPNPINEFRPRYKQKEIQADMKFTPKDRYQRLAEKWAMDKEIIYSWEINHSSDKTPFPNRVKKLYYKTIESVALGASPESYSKDNSRIMLRHVSEERLYDSFDGDDTDKLAVLAQSALEKCKLRPSKESKYLSTKKKSFVNNN